MTEGKRIIEINGIKMELDERTAKVSSIEILKVGDNVKVLIKNYGDEYKSHAGVIIGFDNFKECPTIVILYLDASYSSHEIKIVYVNERNKDVQILKALPEEILFSKARVLDHLNKAIENAESEVTEAQSNKDMFLKWFNRVIELNEATEQQTA